MDYYTFMFALFCLCVVATGSIIVRRLRQTKSELYVVVLSALFATQGMIRLFNSMDYLISSLLHYYSASSFSWDSATLRGVISKLRLGARQDIVLAFVLLMAWRTGIPVIFGFAKAPEQEVEIFLARIETWQSIALYCCLLFLTSAVIQVLLINLPIL